MGGTKIFLFLRKIHLLWSDGLTGTVKLMDFCTNFSQV